VEASSKFRTNVSSCTEGAVMKSPSSKPFSAASTHASVSMMTFSPRMDIGTPITSQSSDTVPAGARGHPEPRVRASYDCSADRQYFTFAKSSIIPGPVGSQPNVLRVHSLEAGMSIVAA
jgi:hypothetical protein